MSNVVQVVLIVILALVLAGILGLIIFQGVRQSGDTIDAEFLLLSSDFSIISAVNVPGETLTVAVRRESGAGTFPTVVLTDSGGKTAIKSYAGDTTIYQTVLVTFQSSELTALGIEDIVKIEVFASARDKEGRVISSRTPKDVKVFVESLVAPSANCGDGKIAGAEGCDDGDASGGDGCSASCQVEQYWECFGQPSVCNAICGDGHRVPGEEVCDEGDNGCDYYPGCDDSCSAILECGNEITECNEECDDGNSNPADQCHQCLWTYCGDNVIQNPNGEGVGGLSGTGDEQCDLSQLGGQTCVSIGYASGTLLCLSSCVFNESNCVPLPQCGNGVIDGGETCDDGGTSSGDGCSGSCQIEGGWQCSGQPSVCSPVCGDGLIRGSETCDDDGVVSGDGCSSLCQVEQYWECFGQPSVCNAICGDFHVVAGEEQCDDGNSNPADQCHQCLWTYCGDGYEQHPNGLGEGGYPPESGQEQCDNGAGNSDVLPNRCRTSCRDPWCGDGVCDSGEIPLLSPPWSGGVIPDTGGGGCYQDCGGSPSGVPSIWDDWSFIFSGGYGAPVIPGIYPV